MYRSQHVPPWGSSAIPWSTAPAQGLGVRTRPQRQLPLEIPKNTSGENHDEETNKGKKNEEEKRTAVAPHFENPDQLVTFVIGREAKKFIVHKELVCSESPVLYAAFNGGFAEGEAQTYRLDDTKPKAFTFLVQWIYSKTFSFIKHPLRSPAHDPECVDEEESLVSLWVLADMLIMPQLQNDAMEQLATLCRSCGPSVNAVDYVYKNTCVDSKLRKVFIHFFAWGPGKVNISKELKPRPAEFLLDLIQEYREAASQHVKEKRLLQGVASHFYVPEEKPLPRSN